MRNRGRLLHKADFSQEKKEHGGNGLAEAGGAEGEKGEIENGEGEAA